MRLGIDRLAVRVIEIQDTLKLLRPTVSLMLLTTLGRAAVGRLGYDEDRYGPTLGTRNLGKQCVNVQINQQR